MESNNNYCDCKEVWINCKIKEYMEVSNKGGLRSNATLIKGNMKRENMINGKYYYSPTICGSKIKYYQYGTIGWKRANLVAEHFLLSKPEEKVEPHHKNSNSFHDCVCNLEWTTRSENLCKRGRYVKKKKAYVLHKPDKNKKKWYCSWTSCRKRGSKAFMTEQEAKDYCIVRDVVTSSEESSYDPNSHPKEKHPCPHCTSVLGAKKTLVRHIKKQHK